MESTGQDLSAGSESRAAQGNEQVDTTEMNGFRAVSASSVGCASVSGVQKVVLLPIAGDISVPNQHRF